MTYCACHAVFLNTLKPAQVVKVSAPEFSLLYHLRIEAAFHLHHQEEHLVI